MTSFVLRGSTAALALSLAFALPLPMLAQETAPAATAESPPATQTMLLDGAVVMALPPGMAETARNGNAQVTDLTLSAADGAPVRLLAGVPRRDLAAQVTRMMASVASVDAAEIGGQPVWIIRGESARSASDERLQPGSGVPARLIVPQYCVDDLPPFMVAMTTAADHADVLDAMSAALALTRPEGAQDCPGVIGPVEALIHGAMDLTALSDPSGTVPEGWTPVTRLGLSFATPPDANTMHDGGADSSEPGFAVNGREQGGEYQLGLRLLTPEAVADVGQPGTDAFRATLQRWADGLPMMLGDRQIMLGGRPFAVYAATGSVTEAGESHPETSLYLAATEAGADGSVLLIGASVARVPMEQAMTLIDGFVGSLALADASAQPPATAPDAAPDATADAAPAGTPPDAAPAPLALLGGYVSLTLAAAQTVSDLDRRSRMADAVLSDASGPVARITAGVIGRRSDAWSGRMLARLDGASDGMVGEVPVWIFDGPAARSVSGDAATGAQDGARVVVPRQCVDGMPPYLVVLAARADQAAQIEALTTALHLALPADATDCPDDLHARLESAVVVMPEPPSQPQVQPQVPQVQPQRPPQAQPSAEAQAWNDALASGDAAQVLAYLQSYPRGLNSGQARAWLHARGIVAPDERTAAATGTRMEQSSDEANWQAAVLEGSTTALWTYLKAEQQGAHRQEALAMLARTRPYAPEAPQVPGSPVK